MLDSYYKTGTKKDYIRWIYIDLTGTISGQFPHTMFTDDSSNYTKEPRLIRHDPVRFLLLHLFYMVSGCMFLKVFSSCYNLIFWRLRSIWNTNTLKTSMCFWIAPHLVTFYLILSVTNSLILITVSSIHFLFCCCHKVRNSFSCCHKMICWNDVILHTNNANAWKILVSQIGSHFVICNDTSPNQHYLMMMPQPMFNVKMCWASSITSTCM